MTNSTSERERQQANLTEHDKTRFLERGFTVVENAGHSLRLIKRDDARQAISIKWDDLPALRELITLALDDGPMVIGLDTSGQAAKNAATAMRDLCVETIRALKNGHTVDPVLGALVADPDGPWFLKSEVASEIEFLTLDNQQPVKEESCCISALLHSRQKAARKQKLEQESRSRNRNDPRL